MGKDIYGLIKRKPLAVYTSSIGKDGTLCLPEECLNELGYNSDPESVFVLTNSLIEGNICLYPKESFDNIVSHLKSLNSFNRNVRLLQMRIMGRAVNTSIVNGTIVVGPDLMESLRFDADTIQAAENDSSMLQVTILRYQNKLEIMSSASYNSEEYTECDY